MSRLATAARVAALAVALAATAADALAAPDAPVDAIARLLAERALAGTSDASADAIVGLLAERGLVGTSDAARSPDGTLASPASSPPDRSGAAILQRLRSGASEMVLTALNFLGVPYRRGGTSADDGFDCSGFTRQVFSMSLGLLLPRRADEQASAAGLVAVQRDDLRPGDLVFFNTLRRTFSHVGIYIGEGKFIHSPKPGSEVRVESMGLAYWAKRFTGARRVDSLAAELPNS